MGFALVQNYRRSLSNGQKMKNYKFRLTILRDRLNKKLADEFSDTVLFYDMQDKLQRIVFRRVDLIRETIDGEII